ncbi:methionyl-tRNA formyltransferase [Candidatus Omnitrophus magneticus]|uniref:Methionyl-tRNA formyltransferase n=1 Tax=Candidatus Omnitrophus magneticus TaxID=1609969 RepID=A0A0F0CU26_9BACT|nr:methionyl-tRNA formyltransferase [Candidatus Omnitrophus magneticus]
MTGIFIGSVEFSARTLEKLIQLKVGINLVVGLRESGFNSDFVDLAPIARDGKIDFIYADDMDSEMFKRNLRDKNPDYIFCIGWSKLLDKEIINIPQYGVIGYHPSLLPQNRGRHPIVWALALGLEKTGSTFFFMDEGADTGDILSQREIAISYEDTARSLYEKLTLSALSQIEEFLPALSIFSPKKIKQDNSKSNVWRKRRNKDSEIDWRMSSYSIYNLIRALTKPYVGADFIYKETRIKIWRAREIKNDAWRNIEYGRVLKCYPDGGFVVKCGENAIHVLEYEPKEIKFEEGEIL